MTSSVYHVHFLGHQLPEQDDELRAFFEKYLEDMAGPDRDGVAHVVQKSNFDDSCRLTVSVPHRLEDIIRRIDQSGLEPVFEEPETPYLEGESCVIPGTFQLQKFGTVLDPRSVSDHPQRQQIIAETLAEHVPDFPEEARDFLNWKFIETDQETGVAIVHWGDDWEEDEGELIGLD